MVHTKKENIYILISNIVIYFLIIYLLFNSKTCITSIVSSTNLFVKKLIPALFPYLVITELLINSNKIYDLSFGFSTLLSKLFRLPKNATSCVVIGFLLGYPNAAKCIASLYKQNLVSNTDCKRLISFTNNANISYILAAIGIGMFNNFKIGIILLISHFLSAIIIGICIPTNKNIIQQNTLNSNSFKQIYSPFELLLTSILGSLKTLGIIFSFTILFSLIPELLLKAFNLPDSIKYFLIGIFELSNGIEHLSVLNLDINLKLCIISFILSFSSIMVLVQIYSYIYITKIKFKTLLLYKFIQGILSAVITYILLKYIHIQDIYSYANTLPVYSRVDTNFKSSIPYFIYILLACFTLLILLLNIKKER